MALGPLLDPEPPAKGQGLRSRPQEDGWRGLGARPDTVAPGLPAVAELRPPTVTREGGASGSKGLSACLRVRAPKPSPSHATKKGGALVETLPLSA